MGWVGGFELFSANIVESLYGFRDYMGLLSRV